MESVEIQINPTVAKLLGNDLQVITVILYPSKVFDGGNIE